MTASQANAPRPPQPSDLQVCLKGPAAKRAALFILRNHQLGIAAGAPPSPSPGNQHPTEQCLPAPSPPPPPADGVLALPAAPPAPLWADLMGASDHPHRLPPHPWRLSTADSRAMLAALQAVMSPPPLQSPPTPARRFVHDPYSFNGPLEVD
eukprot:GGOE01027963.1.p5 GENE.GGOE01027963.1~~GGOE01027963.1.p5  ORF type:complete len:164 (-),score=25.28 GGOE01027963.1:1558-2013(-)